MSIPEVTSIPEVRGPPAQTSAVSDLPEPFPGQVPDPVRAMLAEAIATGKPETVAAVVEVARKASPRGMAEIDLMEYGFVKNRERRLAEAEAARIRAIREAEPFEYWKGNGEIGAWRSTGNSKDLGFTGKLSLERVGIDWRHKIVASADYQRSDGDSTREQYLLSYEPNYSIGERAYIYGLGQYERDRFQGFSSRFALSGGIGYRVIERRGLQLSLNGGPAWRRTRLIEDGAQTQIAGRGALDLDWKATRTLTVTQDASIFAETDNSTFISITGIEAGIGDGLKARLSYSVEHETDPPEDAVKTDTLSRFTLIFGF